MATTTHDVSYVFIELGLVIVGLAVLARLASRWGFSAIPLYLLAGLAFGNGGLAPLRLSENFVRTGAEIGVLLLLFMLGLEYTGDELRKSLRLGAVLVQEDLAMAVYLPLVAVLLSGGGAAKIVLSVFVAIAVVSLVLVAAVRYGHQLSQLVAHESDEIILLTIFGAVLLVAGVAQRFQVSAAIGAFLVGIALSGSVAEQSHRLVSPLRDLFAAIFFFFFGLEIDPTILVPALPFAVGLGAVTTLTKVLTGYWAARRAGIDSRGRLRAGVELVARGEFSIVIAGLGVAIEPRLGPLSAAYVLIMAMLGPLLARLAR